VHRLRALAIGFCVVVASYAIYTSNGTFMGSYDSLPNSVLVPNALQTGRLDFDRFRATYRGSPAEYAFVEAPNGHLTSIFPIGTALVSAPIYLAYAVAAKATGAPQPDLTAPAFEPLRERDEKAAAAFVAALSVALFLACALLLGTPVQAALATLVYAFCTPIWTIAAQALWQHGPVNLAVLAMIYALLRAARATRPPARAAWLAAAGVAAGLLPVIRPTAALFTLAALLFAAGAYRARAGWFVAGLALGIAPGVAWNLGFFYTLVGGYGGNARAFGSDPRHAAAAFAALLVSPSRGFFVYAPVLAFAFVGAWRALRNRTRDGMLLASLALACVMLAGLYACFDYWWAGYSYGPRFLSDASGVAALLLVGVIPTTASLATGAFAATAFASLVVQFAGANGGAAGSEWNAVPISIDFAPQRVWQLHDSQIERNVRGAYDRFFPPVPVGPASATVTALHTAWRTSAGGDTYLVARATVVNDGSTPLFGYASGRYDGQLRVRVRLVDVRGSAPLPDQAIFVAPTIAPGASATATGLVRGARPSATYRTVWEPVIVGGDRVRERAPFRAVLRGTPN
jgi:hypothetical protein